MSSDTVEKVGKLSNPVGQAEYLYNQITGQKAIPEIKYNGASYSTTGDPTTTAAIGAGTFEENRKAIKENNKVVDQLNKDDETFEKFKDKNAALLDNPNAGVDLYTPTYKRNKKLAKDQEAMIQLFNNRKQEILSRSSMPGVAQTRY
jgi:hypothetical protein